MSWALQWLPSRLATHCGSGRLYESQRVREGWSDSPRSPTVIEWLELMSEWHLLLVQFGSKNFVQIKGKGRKERAVPLWSSTSRTLASMV
jgi:hypothetical protein